MTDPMELVERLDPTSALSRAPLPALEIADALLKVESDSVVEVGERRIHGENLAVMAAASIRDLTADLEASKAREDEARQILELFDAHLGEDDGLWTDDSTVGSEWIGSDGVRRNLTFGLFRRARAFLSRGG